MLTTTEPGHDEESGEGDGNMLNQANDWEEWVTYHLEHTQT
jgi:hypothetical protein